MTFEPLHLSFENLLHLLKLLFAKYLAQLTLQYLLNSLQSIKNYLDKKYSLVILAVASANDLFGVLELLDSPFNISLTEI
jgi:hypothetical protein